MIIDIIFYIYAFETVIFSVEENTVFVTSHLRVSAGWEYLLDFIKWP